MKKYIDDYTATKHCVMESLDYDFANEFYGPTHPYFKAATKFGEAIYNTLTLNTYNCKFEIPTFANEVFNVYIYLNHYYDLVDRSEMNIMNKRQPYVDVFKAVLKEYPLMATKNRKIQVFLVDYSAVVTAFVTSRATDELISLLHGSLPAFASLAFCGKTPYVFLKNKEDVEVLINSERAEELRQQFFKIIEKFDLDKIYKEDDYRIMLDYVNHLRVYGDEYFNSSGMYDTKIIM